MNFNQIRKGISNPSLAATFMKDKFVNLPHDFQDSVFERVHPGIDVMEEDWDNLILLDACRYDVFSEENPLSGELEHRFSKGSNSPEFTHKNFNRKHHDTVCVSGNPYLVDIEPDTFHDLISVFDAWDDEVHTIPPEAMTEAALSAHEKYPNKRLIVHYMQPHIPYLGPTGDYIRDQIRKVASPKGWGHTPPSEGEDPEEIEGIREIYAPTLKDVDVTRGDLLTAYKENFHIVIEYVEELLAEIDGKCVISADHGEHLGERAPPTFKRRYGHPSICTTELRKVPWFIAPYESRREISSDPSRGEETKSIKNREEKLRALGYR